MKAVEKAVWYIENHYREEISLDDLARLSGVSRYHLSRIFCYAVGQPISRYVRLRRLSRAAESLASGERDILNLALSVGRAFAGAPGGSVGRADGSSPSRAVAAWLRRPRLLGSERCEPGRHPSPDTEGAGPRVDRLHRFPPEESSAAAPPVVRGTASPPARGPCAHPPVRRASAHAPMLARRGPRALYPAPRARCQPRSQARTRS